MCCRMDYHYRKENGGASQGYLSPGPSPSGEGSKIIEVLRCYSTAKLPKISFLPLSSRFALPQGSKERGPGG